LFKEEAFSQCHS
jgi:mitochondrial import inner membrane translocase subunit TIM23